VPPGDGADAQRERAEQAWELRVLDEASARVLRALRRVLRVKRFELPDVAGALPGVVRRGAHVDLAPLEAALSEAGVRCELRRRGEG
jgi:hypothetical protein